MPTALRVYPGLIHPFFGMPGLSPAADAAVSELSDLLGELLAAPAGDASSTRTPEGA